MKTIAPLIVGLLLFASCNKEQSQLDSLTTLSVALNDELLIMKQQHSALHLYSDSVNNALLQTKREYAAHEQMQNMNFKPFDRIYSLDIWKFRMNFESNNQIMLAGQYHDFEIRKDIETLNWYGLYIDTNGTATLRKCKLKVDAFYDAVAGGQSGKRIYTEGDEKPIVLLQGFNWLSKRTLTLSMHLNKSYHPGTIDALHQFRNPYYTLTALGESGMTGNGSLYDYLVMKNYTISLLKRDYQSRKTNYQHITGSADISMTGKPFSILWAGDIDGDNKPDLIITNEFDYNAGGSVSLYLSSEAKGNKLVQLVSHFHGVGC